MNFFQKIQRNLLLNHPLIWNTRIVPVLLLSGALNGMLFLFFYMVSSPNNTDDDVLVPWILFLSLCSIIGVIVYLIYLLRFNYFKNFGLLRPTDFAFQFLLLFVTLGSIISWPFVPKMAAHMAVAGSYSSGEMRGDLEEAYLLAYQLEYTQSNPPYRKMKIEVVDSLEYSNEDGVNNLLQVPSVRDIDTSRFVKVETHADGTFTGYEKIYLICGYYPYNLYDIDLLSNKIYGSLPVSGQAGREEKLARLSEIFGKYLPRYDGSPFNSLSTFAASDQMTEPDPYYNQSIACDKYRLADLGEVMSGIDNVVFDHEDWRIYLRIWFYTTFYAALLLIIFRYMTARTFLWTLLFTFLLFVFTVIFTIISDPGDNGILAIMLFYYFVFLGFAISLFFTKSRNVFQGIALNLSFFCLHVFPLVLASFLYEAVGADIREPVVVYLERAGLLLVLLSSLFFHSRLFYKWYSLPEE